VLVVWVALHLHSASVFYGGQQGAGVWAVMGAQTTHHGIFFKHWICHAFILKGAILGITLNRNVPQV
jgi:hypothetical protein